MSNSSGVGVALFLISVAAGYQCVGLWQRWNEMNKKLEALEQLLEETKVLQESQSETLEELDGRIREKKDYDESDEIQTGFLQAWHGLFGTWPLKLEIFIFRSKETSIKKNQEWESWNDLPEEADHTDESCTVRDFYLGNSNPDFNWKLESEMEENYRLHVSDTLVNGWDNTIDLQLVISADSKERILEYLGEHTYEYNKTANAFLKKLIDEKKLSWSKILMAKKND